MKRFVVTLTLLLSLTTWAFAQVVEIPDPNLRAAVRGALKLPDDEPITREAMLLLVKLRPGSYGIEDLTGVEFAKNLRELSIWGNPITDLSPIAGLTKLELIYMWGTSVSDITPLANLTELRDLRASYAGGIADITPLANLLKLEKLSLNGNKLTDITPLANLTQLRLLNLEANDIVDVRPLAGLTLLRTLTIQHNRITDHSPLDGLSLEEFTRDLDTPCDMPPLPLAPRIENRNFPSVLAAWPQKDNYAHYDLIFDQFGFNSSLVRTEDGYQFRTWHDSWDGPTAIRDKYLAQNSTVVFLHELYIVWQPLDWLPGDSPYWLRDENGDIELAFGHGRMDLNNPDWQREVVAMAEAIDRCGLYDGIMIDGWSEWHAERRGLLGGQRAILKGIRERVSDNFLILVNTNDLESPVSASYINGLFMETVFPSYRPESDFEFYLTRIENTLAWAHASLLEPKITGLQGFPFRQEPPDSERNKRWMRAFTTMSLTFHDGYVAFTLREGPRYGFWDADLGRPVGETLQLYDSREGLYIREFTKGWAVYNHSGSAQVVTLPEKVQSAATGISNTEHAVLDLDGDIFLRVEVTVPGDLNGDGVVTILDLVIVAQAMGTDRREADVNGDGVINVFDLVFVANQF